MLFRESSSGRARATIGRVREALASRGAGGVKSMQDTVRQFRVFDQDGSGGISRAEFARGLELCLKSTEVWPLPRSDLEALFHVFDRNGDDAIAFEEFALTVRSPLGLEREEVVLRAFEQLCAVAGADPRVGIVLRDIARQYDAAFHPQVQEGRATSGQVLAAYLRGFDKDESEVVSVDEFVDYYAWLSWSIRDDKTFVRMVVESLSVLYSIFP
ncbi:hypothetical protein T492DRAFT_600772 [Pavlovales sp. CCMP2436]|nr:hypothetical protein T492DRAFT_600772 [Pavlovales sp. CCMP2436]